MTLSACCGPGRPALRETSSLGFQCESAVLVAKASTTPWPILCRACQACFCWIPFRIVPCLQLMVCIPHVSVPVVRRPECSASFQQLIYFPGRIFLPIAYHLAHRFLPDLK